MKKSLWTLAFAAAFSLAACGGGNDAVTPAASESTSSASQAVSAPASEAKPASAPAAAASESASAVQAKSNLSPAEEVKAREKIFKAFKQDMGTMGKMIKGDAAFDAAQFQAAAASLDDNAGKPWVHFTADSAHEKSEAKPEIWSKADEFKKQIDKFTAATAALKTAAASGKLDDVKKPFGEVGQSCKSCHEAFRNED